MIGSTIVLYILPVLLETSFVIVIVKTLIYKHDNTLSSNTCNTKRNSRRTTVSVLLLGITFVFFQVPFALFWLVALHSKVNYVSFILFY